MNPVMPTIEDVPQATTILTRALSLEKHGYMHPSILKDRLRAIAIVWLFGLIALIVSVVVIGRGAGPTEQQRLLSGFLAILSVAILVAATLGLFFVLWNAYVYQYVLALDAQSEIIEYQYTMVAEAALNLASDTNFQKELAVELKTVPNATPDALANATVVLLAEKARAARAGMEND